MYQDPRATLERSEVSRQELVDYLAALLGRERKVRWNGRVITVPQALVRASSLGDDDEIRLTPNDILVRQH